MNVCGPVNAGGQCGNALICQYNQKGTHFVAKIAVYDGYFGPRLSLIGKSRLPHRHMSHDQSSWQTQTHMKQQGRAHRQHV